jgi:hypothetical protein
MLVRTRGWMADMAEVSATEYRVSQESPGVYSNRVIVSVGPVVRISFMEQFTPDDPGRSRVAVAIPHQTAVELMSLLKELLVVPDSPGVSGQTKGNV